MAPVEGRQRWSVGGSGKCVDRALIHARPAKARKIFAKFRLRRIEKSLAGAGEKWCPPHMLLSNGGCSVSPAISITNQWRVFF